ncbi:MAG: tetratricopeptide repeat protein [Acidobacteria bacterium]|nr:tetratricopeptide repeat protein [Acidobacteriota bacterium]
MSQNYYTILGVPQNATGRQVRKRFLLLARERHPDIFQGEEKAEAEAQFQLVTEAFNTLSNGDRRRQHDLELAQLVGASDSDSTQVSKLYVRRAKQEIKKGNSQKAVEYLDRATVEDDQNHVAWFELARVLVERRRALPRARVAIARACELQPIESRYLELAGDLYAESGMQDQAEDCYLKALDWGGPDPSIEERLNALRGGFRGGLFGKK